jgi:hypothetical protein
MTRIKKFNQLLESLNPHTRDKILYNLEEGLAVLVYAKDIKYFYQAVCWYSWIECTPIDLKELGVEKTYFVLIGRKLYHTDKPSFGGYEFKVYEPEFD